MTHASNDSIACTSRNRMNGILYSLEREAELERLDRRAGHEYLPMDVYVDPRTTKAHFQDASIRARWKGLRWVAA